MTGDSLLPRHGVRVTAVAGNGARFIRLFRDTWRRVPLAVRRRILRHWRDRQNAQALGVFQSPAIELLTGWARRRRRTLAEVSRNGHLLRFHARSFDRMPDPIACDLIAHELAHVYQAARGWWVVDPQRDRSEEERDADELMDSCGFDAESFDRWAIETGLVKVKTMTPDQWLRRLQRDGR